MSDSAENLSPSEAAHLEKVKHNDPLRHNPYYYGSFWEAFKGGSKGWAGGLPIGLITGGLLGVLVGAVAVPVVGWAALWAAPLVCAFLGAEIAMHKFGEAGNVAGAISGANEIGEERVLTGVQMMMQRALGINVPKPTREDIDAAVSKTPDLMAAHNTDDPHYMSSHSFNGKLYHWDVGITGMVAGLAFGGLLLGMLAIAGSTAGAPILAAIGIAESAHLTLGMSAVILAAFGTLGASFGVERNIFRQIFDRTDDAFAGNFFEKGPTRAIEGHEYAPEILQKQQQNLVKQLEHSAAMPPVAGGDGVGYDPNYWRTMAEHQGKLPLEYNAADSHIRKLSAQRAMRQFQAMDAAGTGPVH